MEDFTSFLQTLMGLAAGVRVPMVLHRNIASCGIDGLCVVFAWNHCLLDTLPSDHIVLILIKATQKYTRDLNSGFYMETP